MTDTSRTLLLLDVDLHCTEEGEGYPLLVHHGGPGLDHNVITPHLQPMAQHLRLISFDHRGAGRSAQPQGVDPYHIDSFVKDIEGLAKILGLERFALLGHSFGGLVALHFALTHPQALSHLILVSTPFSHHYIEDAEAALLQCLDQESLSELSALQAEDPSPRLMRRSLELLAPLYFKEPERVAGLGLDSVRFGPETQTVWESLPDFDLRPRLREVQTPTLVVSGAHDRAVTTEHVQEAARAIPQMKLVTMENSGHYPFIEEPEAFHAAVLEFLDIKVKKKGLFGKRSS